MLATATGNGYVSHPMAFVTIEDRVDRLEALFGQFITEMALANKRAEERHQAAEERHKAAEERMARFAQEMREFKDEMREFKNDMSEFKDEMRAARRALDKKWGDLANKMGTIIEALSRTEIYPCALTES